MLPEVLTVDEVAELLRVDRKGVYSAISRGELPGVLRIGRTMRVSRDVLLEWVRGSARGKDGNERQASEEK